MRNYVKGATRTLYIKPRCCLRLAEGKEVTIQQGKDMQFRLVPGDPRTKGVSVQQAAKLQLALVKRDKEIAILHEKLKELQKRRK